NVTRIVLAGGSSKVISLHRAIERRSRLPLEVADAWRRIEIDPTLDRTYLSAHSPEALVGVGLGMRVQGDNRINLVPEKRSKLAVVTSEPGSRDFAIGCAALAGAAAVVFFAVDQPKRSHLHDLRDTMAKLQPEINRKNGELKGYAELKKLVDENDERAKSIHRLISAKGLPANMMHELGEILTTGRNPTMTDEMARKAGNGPGSDPNKQYDQTWDPSHVWLLSFVDDKGGFTLEGGAQAEADVTQLSKRLAASVYFANVAPSSEERVVDRDTGISYYHFTITGKVA